MATNTIGYYLVPNATGKTTGDFIRIIPNGTAYFADIVTDVTASLSTTEQRLKMVWNEAIKVALDYAARGYTVDLGGIRVRPRIPGSMIYEDQPFTSGVDLVIVDAYSDDELTSVFDNVIPYKVSVEDLAGSIRVSNIMDVTTQVFSTVIGATQFAVLGNGITLDGSDEYVKAYNKKTGVFIAQAIVDRVERGQRAYCHFAASLPDGEVTLEIATHGLADMTALRKFTKPVTAVYVAPPTPHTLTKVTQEANPDNTIQFDTTMQVNVLGTNLSGFNASRGDTVKWELVENNVVTDTSDNTQDIVSTTATQIHFEGAGEEDPALPFRGSLESAEEWYGKHGRVKVTINGVTKTVENVFFTNT